MPAVQEMLWLVLYIIYTCISFRFSPIYVYYKIHKYNKILIYFISTLLLYFITKVETSL